MSFEQAARAVESGNLSAVKELLAAGLNPNVSDGDINLLWCAVKRDDARLTRLILQAGADVRVRFREDNYPVILIARSPTIARTGTSRSR